MKNKTTNKLFFARIFVGNEKDFFIDSLAMLIDSGMDILSALDAIEKEARSVFMARIVKGIKDDVESGSYLWQALSSSKIMKPHIISLVKAGEDSGRLKENLNVIVDRLQKDRLFRSKLRSAMMYPSLVISLTLFLGIGIAWFILPRLTTVFSNLRIELPVMTKILIAVGNFLAEYGTVFIPSLLAAISLFLYFIFINSKTKFIGQFLLFSFSGIRRLIQEVEISRFGYTLGSLLKAGLPITQSLDSLRESSDFYYYKKLYRQLNEKIKEGYSIQESFNAIRKSHKYVPLSVQYLITAGEKSSNLPNILIKIGKSYEAKNEITTKNLTTLLEPILLIAVWLGVVFVATAVIMPIYSLVGGFNRNPTTTSHNEPVVEVVNSDVESVLEQELLEKNDKLAEENKKRYLEIGSTPVNYLNVRDKADVSGEKISAVNPGEIYEYISEENDWYEIVLDEERQQVGWVAGEYVNLVENYEE